MFAIAGIDAAALTEINSTFSKIIIS